MATYSPKDFENSRFNYGERVVVHLYAPNGALMKTIEGRLEAREKDVEIEEGRTKTLVWVKDIEGYEVPGDIPGQTVERTEGWFPEHDIDKAEKDTVIDNLSLN